MQGVTVYDSEGDVTLSVGDGGAGEPTQVARLGKAGVELYFDGATGRLVVYIKARTSLVDNGNRLAYYHVELTPERGEDPAERVRAFIEELGRTPPTPVLRSASSTSSPSSRRSRRGIP
jgi:hypothetical protein